jgi:hypothetical protein
MDYIKIQFNPIHTVITYFIRVRFNTHLCTKAITLAARSKARNVFARSNTGIVSSNPTRGMDVCVYSEFVLSCVRSGLATWLITRQRSPTDCLQISIVPD